MKFSEALTLLRNGTRNLRIYRADWPYYLIFNKEGYLILVRNGDEITPYTISLFDFDYEWRFEK